MLALAGDAALGDHRSLFERQWKGTAAALLGLALGIHWWRHHRWRRRNRSRPPAGEAARVESAPADATVLTMPALGEHVAEGTVTRWLKKVGDPVGTDEPLLEVSTDKVDTEIPSPASGTLLEIKVGQDETVPTGAALAVIGVVRRSPSASATSVDRPREG